MDCSGLMGAVPDTTEVVAEPSCAVAETTAVVVPARTEVVRVESWALTERAAARVERTMVEKRILVVVGKDS